MKSFYYRGLSMLLLLAFTFSMAFSSPAHAQGKYVTVSIPTFYVQIDDMSVDSAYMQYPLIVHNDITYFPLTWNWCHYMHLAVGYDKVKGLYILERYNGNYFRTDKMDDGGYQAAGSTFTASVVDYPVYVNGTPIDNSKEKYPLLNFRGITYFPLTWRFVVDEFGWSQKWSAETGLIIKPYREGKHPVGSSYENINTYFMGDYYDYALVEKDVETMRVDKSEGEDDISTSSLGKKEDFYKLDYKTNEFTKLDSDKTDDTPYNSGKIKAELVEAPFDKKAGSHLFKKDGSKILYNDKFLIDTQNDAGKGNIIDNVFVHKYRVNNLNVYEVGAYMTQDGKQIPAPYTPEYNYIFVEKPDGSMTRIKEYPADYPTVDIFDDGAGGFYIASPHISMANAHQQMRPALLYRVGSDLKVELINDRWSDWQSVEAIGSDKDHNLYLINTWYSRSNPQKADLEDMNLLSPVNDGYFKLGTNGNLSQIYPYIELSTTVVTPDGDVYGDKYDRAGFIHLQSGKWLLP